MATFLSIRLRTVGMALGHPVVCSDWWGPISEQVLRDEGVPYESWTFERLEELASHDQRIAHGV